MWFGCYVWMWAKVGKAGCLTCTCVVLAVCFFLSADYLESLMKFREIIAPLKYRG